MKIKRAVQQLLAKRIGQNKVLLLFGTRRVGKTHLLKAIEQTLNIPFLHLNAEDIDVLNILENRSVANYERLLAGQKLLVIDEAQVIPEIGKILKLMIDTFNDLTIIATGSSAFDLSNQTGEPLTGRSYTYFLYPIAQSELAATENILQTKQNLDDRLVFGSYPEIFQLETPNEKAEYLKNLVNSYLLKDILHFENIQNSAKIYDLLRLIAYQVGSEVSLDQLGKKLGLSKNTVERYLDLLTKVQILFKLSGFSSNLRKEVTKSSKWYFFDNGIRNAVINDFRLVPVRQDMGLLWENYCIYERIKANNNAQTGAEYFFWRTYDQQEIDLIEKKNQVINAFEFRYGEAKKKAPAFFVKNYPNAGYKIISKEDYLDFVLGKI
ncbi:ATP-binding protein [Pedobacter cryophilus]|uniref:ATP-binding protein n=1 Tax=Pedobacter cryophilus TaxID=2571271 RepID=A0A4U1C645_9SPHI|nr:ATP-binding protein [Pedobacter cryophilus]TKC00913.1 ATP-binding protein [Pedobacter cryophilus]